MDDLNPEYQPMPGEAPPAAAPPVYTPPSGDYLSAPPPYYVAGQQLPGAEPPAEPSAAPARSSVGVAVVVAIIAALIVGTLAGVAAGFAGARLASGRSVLTPAKITVVPSTTSEPVVAASAAAVPSVVNIDITEATSTDSGDGSLPQGHPSVPVTGNGSGVAYEEVSGGGTYILTNDHVVANASKIVVRDASGGKHTATLIGTDPETDIAVVKISDTIPTIQLGDSDKLNVGQLVVAIGSPYGLEHSVTSGVVSAIGRSLPDFSANASGVYPLVNVIQTDAAINPGNSGGALVDRTGLLVGINTAIYSDSGSNGGIGFAIPVNTAKRVADSLITGGKVEHPFLGIIGETVDEQLAKQENLTVTEGALVVDLTPGTNAVKAGIKKGDVIVSLAGKPIRSMDDLLLQVRQHGVGETVEVKLIRGGKEVTLTMTVGAKPANLGSVDTTPTQQ